MEDDADKWVRRVSERRKGRRWDGLGQCRLFGPREKKERGRVGLGWRGRE